MPPRPTTPSYVDRAVRLYDDDGLDVELACADLLQELDAVRTYVAAQSSARRDPRFTDERIVALHFALTQDLGLADRDDDEAAEDHARLRAESLRAELAPGNLGGFAELLEQVKAHYLHDEDAPCTTVERARCGECEHCETGLAEYRTFRALFGAHADEALALVGNLRRAAGRPRKGGEDNSHETVYRKLLDFLGHKVGAEVKLRNTLGPSHTKTRMRRTRRGQPSTRSRPRNVACAACAGSSRPPGATSTRLKLHSSKPAARGARARGWTLRTWRSRTSKPRSVAGATRSATRGCRTRAAVGRPSTWLTAPRRQGLMAARPNNLREGTQMQKFLAASLAALVFVGCGRSDKSAPAPAESSSSAPVAAPVAVASVAAPIPSAVPKLTGEKASVAIYNKDRLVECMDLAIEYDASTEAKVKALIADMKKQAAKEPPPRKALVLEKSCDEQLGNLEATTLASCITDRQMQNDAGASRRFISVERYFDYHALTEDDAFQKQCIEGGGKWNPEPADSDRMRRAKAQDMLRRSDELQKKYGGGQ